MDRNIISDPLRCCISRKEGEKVVRVIVTVSIVFNRTTTTNVICPRDIYKVSTVVFEQTICNAERVFHIAIVIESTSCLRNVTWHEMGRWDRWSRTPISHHSSSKVSFAFNERRKRDNGWCAVFLSEDAAPIVATSTPQEGGCGHSELRTSIDMYGTTSIMILNGHCSRAACEYAAAYGKCIT